MKVESKTGEKEMHLAWYEIKHIYEKLFPEGFTHDDYVSRTIAAAKAAAQVSDAGGSVWCDAALNPLKLAYDDEHPEFRIAESYIEPEWRWTAYQEWKKKS